MSIFARTLKKRRGGGSLTVKNHRLAVNGRSSEKKFFFPKTTFPTKIFTGSGEKTRILYSLKEIQCPN